jgi:hypothetical protein
MSTNQMEKAKAVRFAAKIWNTQRIRTGLAGTKVAEK